jgi:hypothetical protein
MCLDGQAKTRFFEPESKKCGPSLHWVHRSAGWDCREFTPPKTMQYTVNSTFSLNCKVQP